MSDAVYIVTGAAGHLGSHVVRELLERGRRVRALVLPGESCPPFIDGNRQLLTEVVGDVRVPESLEPLFAGDGRAARVVIHCAGIVTITQKTDSRVYDVNVGGTANIIAACRRHGVRRLVYISSVHALPLRPPGEVTREVSAFSPDAVPGYYDKTKAIATQLVLDAAAAGLDAVVLHPSGIIGPHGLPTGNMTQVIALCLGDRLPVAVRGGYDFVDVRDVAAGILAAVERGRSGEGYILANRYIAMQELLTELAAISGRRGPRLYLPLWAAGAVAPAAEWYYRATGRTPTFTRYSLHSLGQQVRYASDKARRELGYVTRSLRETLADIVDWAGSGG